MKQRLTKCWVEFHHLENVSVPWPIQSDFVSTRRRLETCSNSTSGGTYRMDCVGSYISCRALNPPGPAPQNKHPTEAVLLTTDNIVSPPTTAGSSTIGASRSVTSHIRQPVSRSEYSCHPECVFCLPIQQTFLLGWAHASRRLSQATDTVAGPCV